MVHCIHIGPCSLKISNQLDNDYFAQIFIVYLHSLITLPMFFFFFSFQYCSILRRALSLAPLIALRNFTQRRMVKTGQLIMLRHFMYATYTKILIFFINFMAYLDRGGKEGRLRGVE